jgi:hypothetical protein
MISQKAKDERTMAEPVMRIGMGKTTRRTYGFDEIALVPGNRTLDVELCDISYRRPQDGRRPWQTGWPGSA